MKEELYTELRTLSNTELQIEVITDKTINSEILEFESKLSLLKYIDRLRKNLHKTDMSVCIIDDIRNITYKFNLDNTEHQKSHTKEKRLRGDNLRFIPKTMVKVEKSSKEIKKEKIQNIMMDISVGNLEVAKDELEKLFG